MMPLSHRISASEHYERMADSYRHVADLFRLSGQDAEAERNERQAAQYDRLAEMVAGQTMESVQ